MTDEKETKRQDILDSLNAYGKIHIRYHLFIENQFRKEMISYVQDRILNASKQIEKDINKSLDDFNHNIDDTLQQISSKDQFTTENDENRYYFVEKHFQYKQSVLTEYFKIENYKTLYNMIVATMILLGINLVFTEGTLFDMKTFVWTFSHSEKIIFPLIIIFLISLSVVPLVGISVKNKLAFYIYIPILIFLICFINFYAQYVCYQFDLAIGSAMIILCESVRMSLKMWSYVRNKMLYCTDNKYKDYIPKQYKNQGFNKSKLHQPKFDLQSWKTEIKRYSYFMFCPTLIYRDEYIKTPKRDFSAISMHIINFFLSIYFGFVLFKTFCKPQILYFSQNISLESFISVVFKLMLPGTLSLYLLFFGLLHSWLNAWAELFRFPDRTFYLDWWNSKEFGSYYRKWNIVIHEWLYYYVYGDSVRFSNGRLNKQWASFLTFIISAVIHEVIICFSIGFFYPILFLIFSGPGTFLIKNKQSLHNITFWILMYIGTALIFTLYMTEYYAREKMDPQIIQERWGVLSFAIPRTFYIHLIKH